MIMNNEIDLKIATLNLNGETFWSINRRPRLPQDLFNIKEIKEALVDKIKDGLENILNNDTNDTYDIIAIQELVYISDYYNDIKDVIEENGYQLIIPKELKNTHFTVGFIVKNDIKAVIEGKGYQLIIPKKLKNTHFTVGLIVKKGIKPKNTPIENNVLLNEIPKNKIIRCKFTKNRTSYEILNVHLTKHTDDIKNALLDFLSSNNNDNNNVIRILLGDFNAYNDEQKDKEVQPCNNAKFINDLMKNDFRKNYESTNKNYTFWATGWKKLDHIFISGKNIDVKEIDVEETVNNNVNFYPIENALNNNKGFTDHSMLTAIIRDNKPK